jgi:hypothetical protein
MQLNAECSIDDIVEWQAIADSEAHFDFVNTVARLASEACNVDLDNNPKFYLTVVLGLFGAFMDLLNSQEQVAILSFLEGHSERDPESPRTATMAALLREYPEFHPAILSHGASNVYKWNLEDATSTSVAKDEIEKLANSLFRHSLFLEQAHSLLLSHKQFKNN